MESRFIHDFQHRATVNMGAINLAEWQKLPISLSELCINTTLRCGQSFRYELLSHSDNDLD